MASNIAFPYTAAAAAGVVSHLAYFNRGEHHLYGVRYIQLFSTLYATAITAVFYMSREPFGHVFRQVSIIAACYFAGLYTSLLVYRCFLSPLSKFPGPYGAKISNFWYSSHLAQHDGYKRMLKHHERYGDYVRIGSNDLSIVHPKAVNAIYGLGSKCRKAAWYDITQPMVSIQTTRDKPVHDHRRRIWSFAFSDKALRGYEERIRVYQDKLIKLIDSHGSQGVNVAKYFNFYSFDVMGDLAFGKSFSMLDSSEEHWAIKLLNEGIAPLGYMLPVWFFRIMTALPIITRDWWKFISFCTQNLEERMAVRDANQARLQHRTKTLPRNSPPNQISCPHSSNLTKTTLRVNPTSASSVATPSSLS